MPIPLETNGNRPLPAPGKQEPARDKKGQYRITHPNTGKLRSYTRATTISGTLEDTLQLHRWEMRMLAKGISQRPDLIDLAAGHDPNTDRDTFDQITDTSLATAKTDQAANDGTALHRFTELWDTGSRNLDDYPERFRPHLTAYQAALDQSGLTIEPELTETVIVNDNHRYAGSVDRFATADKQITAQLPGGKKTRITKGTRIIADLKTGKMAEYKNISFATQISLYAQHTAVWNVDRDHKDGGTRGDRIKVSQRLAAIIHLPATDPEPVCTIYWVDLEAAEEYVEEAIAVRALRSAPVKRKLIGEYLRTDKPAPSAPPVDPVVELNARLAEIKRHPAATEDLIRRWPTCLRNGRDEPCPLPDDPSTNQVVSLMQAVEAVEQDHEIPFIPTPKESAA